MNEYAFSSFFQPQICYRDFRNDICKCNGIRRLRGDLPKSAIYGWLIYYILYPIHPETKHSDRTLARPDTREQLSGLLWSVLDIVLGTFFTKDLQSHRVG